MARLQGSVEIVLPIDEVFRLYTDAQLVDEWAIEVQSRAAYLNVVEDGPGTQCIWTIVGPEAKTEMLETVFDYSPPHRVASHLQITRVLPLEPHEATPGVMPLTAYDLAGDYSPIYGKLPCEGVMACDFTATETGTRIDLITEMKLGAMGRVMHWVNKLSRRHPMQAQLEAFRDWAEARPRQDN